jgi:hypothetical protein
MLFEREQEIRCTGIDLRAGEQGSTRSLVCVDAQALAPPQSALVPVSALLRPLYTCTGHLTLLPSDSSSTTCLGTSTLALSLFLLVSVGALPGPLCAFPSYQTLLLSCACSSACVDA